MNSARYKIVLHSPAKNTLRSLIDKKIRKQIIEKIDSLTFYPDRGKPLRGPLAKYRSLKAARNRYRIIYWVEKGNFLIHIIAVGLRKSKNHSDIYQTLQRFLKH